MSTPHPTNMLEHWLEQEQLVKQAMAKGPGVGTPNPDDISHLSGLGLPSHAAGRVGLCVNGSYA
jgi:hypothetical protein